MAKLDLNDLQGINRNTLAPAPAKFHVRSLINDVLLMNKTQLNLVHAKEEIRI